MEQELISKLKVKPNPKPPETFEILLKQQEADEFNDIKIKTKIIDQTQKKLIDREDFLKELDLGVKKSVTPLIDTPIGIGEEKLDTDIPKTDVAIPDKKSKKSDPDLDKMKEDLLKKPLILNIKKLNVKFTITKENILVDIDAVADSSISRKDRLTKKPEERPLVGPVSLLGLKDQQVLFERLPNKEPELLIKSPNYYMNNREIFINFINSLFEPYKQELLEQDKKQGDSDDPNNPNSCDKKSDEFKALTHQKIVKDYINIFSPYRGLLLYHGLGSGKTCSSIGIAEGLKNNKEVIIMTPASLQANYKEELKKCGDIIYKKTQYWEFLNTSSNAGLANELSKILNIPIEFINERGGAWFVDAKKKANYDSLSGSQQKSLNEQLDEMIRSKYRFLNYNGLRLTHLTALTKDYTINPFTDKVVIIDEAHNLISRIINKLKNPKSLAMRLYEYLMSAENCKIVLLSGTPIINYPNEIGILFNILRGYIHTYYFKLKISDKRKIDLSALQNIFKSTKNSSDFIDYIEYKPSSNMLVITQNPFNFKSTYKSGDYQGVEFSSENNLTHSEFIDIITKVLKDNKIEIEESGQGYNIKIEQYKALPDNYDQFKNYFIDDSNNVKNQSLLKHRIMGLTSHFPDMYQLLPKYQKSTDFIVVKLEMSDFQFGVYEEARVQERKLEQNNKKKKKQQKDDVYSDSVSTYRIFSRAFCNFVFPRPDIKRPFPNDDDNIETAINDENLDAIVDTDKLKEGEVFDADQIDEADKIDRHDEDIDDIDDVDGEGAEDLSKIKTSAITKNTKKALYEKKIREAIKNLEKNGEKYLTREALTTYSPKFLNILENLGDAKYRGLHLIYSQFRTLEGIGILKLVLEANGFVEFKIKKSAGGDWVIDIAKENYGKPKFALYTGTETVEEREIVRNIFNNNTNILPASIVGELKTISETNLYGDIIKVLMITASGAEGINLKNVRYVHITEPYWHPVRIEQVIGRARRICSHSDLPIELQTVQVFLYLMTFSKSQLESDVSIELRLKDKSKKDGKTPLTSDEALHEISTIKETINKNLLTTIKESAIDCSIHIRAGSKEKLQCFSIGNPDKNNFSYLPNINQQEVDKMASKNKQEITWKAIKVKIEGIEYALRKETGEVYDLDSYKQKNPLLIGNLEIKGKEYKFTKL